MSRGVAELCDRIESMMRGGASLDEVEGEVIDDGGLSEQQKSALWLYAWSLMPPGRQHREALALVALAR